MILYMTSREKLIQVAEQRAQTIEEYIKNHPDCDVKMEKNVFQSGKIELANVYLLPINLLRLNPNNGRFKAELDVIYRDRKDENKSIELDPDNDEDVKIMQDMIEGKYPSSSERKNAYKSLRDNICEIAQKTGTNGQEEPGLITHDGILINGNRRWIIMNELAEVNKNKKGEPLKYNKLRVARLKKNIDKYDLWKNEAKEQISQESREEYDYVNSALEIKQGYDLLIAQEMTDKKAKSEIAKTLYGRTEKDVNAYLEFLEIADLFLDEINKEGQYTYMQESGNGEKGIVTILQDVGKDLKKYANAGISISDKNNLFIAMCAFCKFSKDKPEVPLDDGTLKKLSFGHREYRFFQKKIMDQPSIRDKFLRSEILKNIDLENLTPNDASKFYQVMRESQEEYDIQMDINTPISLINKAKNALSKVSQDLTGSRKKDMVEQIKNESGLEHLHDIKSLIEEILKKIKPSK